MAFKADKLPSNVDAEYQLLASMTSNKGLILGSDITEDSFSDQRNRMIFKVLERLASKGKDTGIANIIDVASSQSAIAALGGEQYVRDLASHRVDFNSGLEYARIVRESYQRRKIIETARIIEEEAKQGGNPDDLAMRIADISKNSMPKLRENSIGIERAMMDLSADVMEYATSGKTGKIGMRTGFTEIDRFLNGIDRDGTFVIIGARPSTGKTALLNQLSWQLSNFGEHGMFFSQEMNEKKLAVRISAMLAGLDSRKIRDRSLSIAEAELLKSTVERCAPILGSHMDLIHNPVETVKSIRARALQYVNIHGKIDYILIDYFQNIGLGEKSYSRTDELEQVSKLLNALSKELHCVVFLAAQLNRGADESSQPHSGQIKGSGQSEQDADIIMLLSRKESRVDRSDGKDIILIDIAKGRDYGIAEILVSFDPVVQRFDTGIFDKNTLTKKEWENLDGKYGKGFDAFSRAFHGDD